MPPHRPRPLAAPPLGRLLVGTPALQLAERALALHLLLENAQGGVHVVVAHVYLHRILRLNSLAATSGDATAALSCVRAAGVAPIGSERWRTGPAVKASRRSGQLQDHTGRSSSGGPRPRRGGQRPRRVDAEKEPRQIVLRTYRASARASRQGRR